MLVKHCNVCPYKNSYKNKIIYYIVNLLNLRKTLIYVRKLLYTLQDVII